MENVSSVGPTINESEGNARSSQTRDRLAKDSPNEREPDGMLVGWSDPGTDPKGFNGDRIVIFIVILNIS